MGYRAAMRGFTLIELLVTMSVAVILMAVAVPNLSDFLRNNRASQDVQLLARSLMAARSEAISRGEAVQVTATGGDWASGWRSWVDLDGDGTEDSGETIKVIAGLESGSSLSAAQGGSAASALTFSADGALMPFQAVSFEYRTSPEKCSRDRNIQINVSGHLSVSERPCP
ncbi:GspH/FimT family pseudopilin [Spongiibacter tropicus]|uniref:GspH/FimT family pseudopilin n=1 Tax=Spongiibacter tropicus TaxID=454602 RepID=UPI0035BE2CE0